MGSLYRALPPRLLSVVPMIGIQFSVYEFMKRWLLKESRYSTTKPNISLTLEQAKQRIISNGNRVGEELSKLRLTISPSLSNAAAAAANATRIIQQNFGSCDGQEVEVATDSEEESSVSVVSRAHLR